MKDRSTIQLKLSQMFHWKDGFAGMYLKKCFPIILNELFYGIGQMLINIVIGHQSSSAIAAMAAFRVLEGFVFAFFGGLADASTVVVGKEQMLINIVIGHQSSSAIAAMAAFRVLEGFVFAFFGGLADASTVVVGKEVGSGHHMKGYQYVKGFSILCPAITFIIVLTCLLLNRPLLGLFGLGAEAMFYGKYMLLIYLAAGTIRTCNYIMNSCFRAGGESVFGTVLWYST